VDFIERQGKKVTRACAVDGLDSSGFCVFFLLFLLRLDYRFWIKATGTFCTGKFWTPSVLKKTYRSFLGQSQWSFIRVS
jgi:hypothetical protein